jgi:hypothetical protein
MGMSVFDIGGNSTQQMRSDGAIAPPNVVHEKA